MRYYNAKKYFERVRESPLPELTDNERIYFKVDYMSRHFARQYRMGFDSEKKLWFTGAYNSDIDLIVHAFDVDEEHTSADALELLQMALDTEDRDELLAKILDWYEERGIIAKR